MKAQDNMACLVREFRKRPDLNQGKFAANFGVTTPAINRWENGREKPAPLALNQIGHLLREMGHEGQDLHLADFTEESA